MRLLAGSYPSHPLRSRRARPSVHCRGLKRWQITEEYSKEPRQPVPWVLREVMTHVSAGWLVDGLRQVVLQVSASAPLLQGVKKAVRVSVIAMGAAPLAPKDPEPEQDPGPLTDEKVRHTGQHVPVHASCCSPASDTSASFSPALWQML